MPWFSVAAEGIPEQHPPEVSSLPALYINVSCHIFTMIPAATQPGLTRPDTRAQGAAFAACATNPATLEPVAIDRQAHTASGAEKTKLHNEL